jgi:hypothetical protein
VAPKYTTLFATVELKLVPAMVTVELLAPFTGLKELIVGCARSQLNGKVKIIIKVKKLVWIFFITEVA